MKQNYKFCYALVYKDDNTLPLIQGTLPIYWDEDVAKLRVKNFNNIKIVEIKTYDLNNILKSK